MQEVRKKAVCEKCGKKWTIKTIGKGVHVPKCCGQSVSETKKIAKKE